MKTFATPARPVVHVTTVHGPLDSRIYYKEVLSLASVGVAVELATTVNERQVHNGIPFLPLGSREGSRWRRLIRDARAMRLMLLGSHGIIHIHDPELLLAAFLPALLGRTLVFDVHEFYLEKIAVSHWIPGILRAPVTRIYDFLERTILKHFAGVVIVSEAMRERYSAILSNDRVALVQNYPNIDREDAIAARSAPHPLEGRPYILHTGGAMRLRAFHIIVEAAEFLRAQGCVWPIINLGEVDLSEYSPAVADDLAKRALSADVRNLGLVPQTTAWNYVAHAGIAYMPLIVVENNVRGMPNKLFEYLSFGLPIVASKIGRVAEIVAAADAGILVPPENSVEDGRALILLAENADIRTRYGKQASTAGKSFTFSGEAGRLLALYARIAH